MSVTWVLTNGSYEVSSKEHLLQLMNTGSLYTDAGTSPSSYLSSSYIQTANIDLLNDITNILPISTFTGEYDGGNFSVSNWSCTTSGRKGFFGTTNGAVIKNMVLDGIWTCSQIVDGSLFSAHNSNSQFYNITTNFSTGTTIEGSSSSLGIMFAYTGPSCIIEGLTVGGTITTFTGSGYTGCITGYSSAATYNHVRNIATFENTVTTTHSHLGGMIGRSNNDTISYMMNAMTGDLSGHLYVGGIFGYLSGGTTNYINQSMTGSLTAAGSGVSGGISSYCTDGGTASTHIVNYMTGDVENGFFGTNLRDVNTSIIAMSGTTTNVFSETNSGTVEILLNETYGITYTDSTDTVTTMDTSSFLTDLTLPYFAFSLLDGGGTQHDWTFVFGNVLPEGITSVIERPLSALVTILSVSGGTSYLLTYQSPTGPEESVPGVSNAIASGIPLVVNVTSPATIYTLKFYVDGTLFQTETFTTLANSAANYDKSDYQGESSVYDLTNLSDAARGNMSEIMNTLFTTGEKINVSLSSGLSVSNCTFVNEGGVVDVTSVDAILMPFDTSIGSGQGATLTLSDTSTEAVTYDDTTETITIDSIVYSPGDVFILDGKKVTIGET